MQKRTLPASYAEEIMNEDILHYFGRRVRELRVNLGLSQEELADKAGLHRTYIGMIERAEKNITLRNIEKIAAALGVHIMQLFTEYGNPNNTEHR
jgi:transcriptional regulator with XRE-family HTH domain